MTKKRPKKIETCQLLERVRQVVESGDYLDTRHAEERRSQRGISRLEMESVLTTGRHEKAKDQFQEAYEAWNYAIRGRTIDKRDLRVVVSFEEKMLVITAIEIGK